MAKRLAVLVSKDSGDTWEEGLMSSYIPDAFLASAGCYVKIGEVDTPTFEVGDALGGFDGGSGHRMVIIGIHQDGETIQYHVLRQGEHRNGNIGRVGFESISEESLLERYTKVD